MNTVPINNQQVGNQYIADVVNITQGSHQRTLSNLRAPVADFVGRNKEIDEIVQLLGSNDGGMAVISRSQVWAGLYYDHTVVY